MTHSNNTDKEDLKELLTKFGVEFTVSENNITCEQNSNRVAGYCGFFTNFEFDKAGKFIEMGAYE